MGINAEREISDRRKRRCDAAVRRRRRMRRRLAAVLITAAAAVLLYNACSGISSVRVNHMGKLDIPSWVDSRIIAVDGHSRSGRTLDDVNDIVIHYVGNPGTTAQANHDYFASDASDVSSHFIVGLQGEIIQCIPLDECSAASNHRNSDTISIEVCHPDSSGKFNDDTYQSLVKLTAWLCREAGLDESHVIRHYDVTGKICPKYFVEHEDAWELFKCDVADMI